MDYLPSISLQKIFIVTSILTVVSFFTLLITANYLNRNSIKESALLEHDIADLQDRTEKMNQAIATFSSLVRVEQRAKELGFDKSKHVEYIK
jgi:cell division protein FtsL